MKKLFLTLLVIYTSLSSFALPNEKVTSHFNRCFPDAQHIVWVNEEGGSYLVYFTRGEEKFRLWYNNEGVITKSIRYYGKNLLSPFIHSRIEARYKNKTIFYVTEVTTDAGVDYLIVMEDDKKWYHIKSDASGNMHISQTLKKA